MLATAGLNWMKLFVETHQVQLNGGSNYDYD